MTYNDPSQQFSQSQLAMLGSMPSAVDVAGYQPVHLYLAPSGCKAVPENIIDPSQLLQHGWKDVMVGEVVRPTVHTLSHGIRGRRIQYGFKHRIAATVHATLGCDFRKLATSVSTTHSEYRLWEKEQAVVLLSRTFRAKDIIFVGNKEDTINALASLVQRRSQYSDYISHLLGVLCGHRGATPELSAPVIRNELIPFRPIDVQLPQESSGYCYIILSLQNRKATYIGQTMSLVKRLNQHNRGTGSIQTSSYRLRPWSLIAFVCGFDSDRRAMRRFETHWERKRDELQRSRRISSPPEIADVARTIISEWQANGEGGSLRYVQAGTFDDW
jgi:predicted GIY-YIG superfamily endonuclease